MAFGTNTLKHGAEHVDPCSYGNLEPTLPEPPSIWEEGNAFGYSGGPGAATQVSALEEDDTSVVNRRSGGLNSGSVVVNRRRDGRYTVFSMS